MERSIFAYIWRYSRPQQITILVMTLASLPFFYASLELPKMIVNDALGRGEGETTSGTELFGYSFTAFEYLALLCAGFLGLVLINGAFKYVINVYKGVVGERMLRRLRFELYSRILRFPLTHFRRISGGETVQMITAEVEPLGGFIGDSVATPVYQGGMLLTILAFMFMQNPVMGLAAIALYPLQIYIIPKLQHQVNMLGKRRVRQVRVLAERINETVSGVTTIRANDATQYERARFSHELGVVFDIRMRIYIKKFFIKFLNNFFAQLAPFFFYLIGGYLILTGELTLGALVAVIAAHDKLYGPWKELLTYYQLWSDVRIKYDQVITQFDLPNIRNVELQDSDKVRTEPLEGSLAGRALTLAGDDGLVLDAVSFETLLPAHIALVGPSGSGKEDLLLLLAVLHNPDSGRLTLDDEDVLNWPESISGRRLAYVPSTAQIFKGSVRDNILYGLKNRPRRELPCNADQERERTVQALEALRSGNSRYDYFSDWLDWETLDVEDEDDLLRHIIAMLKKVCLERDIYNRGLRGTLPDDSTLQEQVLQARKAMRARLDQDKKLKRLVEVFDDERYNDNATLAENLLFAAPLDPAFAEDALARQPDLRASLRAVDLEKPLAKVGYKLADTMVELFADLPPDHEFFRQYSFITPEDLPSYKTLLTRIDENQLDQLKKNDYDRLIGLSFKLITSRHRLGLIDDPLKEKVLRARKHFRENLAREQQGKLAFFHVDQVIPSISLQDNILFGRIAYGQAQAKERVEAVLEELLDERDLRRTVLAVGLETEVGVNGSRLNAAQRQKLALARALLKRPDLLLLHDAIGALDTNQQTEVINNILDEMRGRSVIWAVHRPALVTRFNYVLVMQDGRVVEQGKVEELNHGETALRDLMAAE